MTIYKLKSGAVWQQCTNSTKTYSLLEAIPIWAHGSFISNHFCHSHGHASHNLMWLTVGFILTDWVKMSEKHIWYSRSLSSNEHNVIFAQEAKHREVQKRGFPAMLRTWFDSLKLKFVCRFKSIPAFTANWTMELFQKEAHDWLI